MSEDVRGGGRKDQSMSMPMERPSPGTRALRDFACTLIFSRIFSCPEVSAAMGSTSLTDAVFSSFFFRCARSFSLLAAILHVAKPSQLQGQITCCNGWDAPVLPEGVLPLLLDLRNPLHCLDRVLHQLAVVAYWDISALLELDSRVLDIVRNVDTQTIISYSPLSSPCPPPYGMPSSSAPYGGCASS